MSIPTVPILTDRSFTIQSVKRFGPNWNFEATVDGIKGKYTIFCPEGNHSKIARDILQVLSKNGTVNPLQARILTDHLSS